MNRKSAPNLLLLKRNVKYMYKADERRRDRGGSKAHRLPRFPDSLLISHIIGPVSINEAVWRKLISFRTSSFPVLTSNRDHHGRPGRIGPEVVLKAVAEEEIRRVCIPVIIGDAQLLAHTARTLDLQSGYEIVRRG